MQIWYHRCYSTKKTKCFLFLLTFAWGLLPVDPYEMSFCCSGGFVSDVGYPAMHRGEEGSIRIQRKSLYIDGHLQWVSAIRIPQYFDVSILCTKSRVRCWSCDPPQIRGNQICPQNESLNGACCNKMKFCFRTLASWTTALARSSEIYSYRTFM